MRTNFISNAVTSSISSYRVAAAVASVAALAMVGACADSPAGPEARATVTTTGTFANAGQVNVCIDATSPAGTYTISSAGSVVPANGSSVLTGSINLAPGACGTIYQRTVQTSAGGDDLGQIKATVTANPVNTSLNVDGVDCVLDAGVSAPLDCTEPDATAAIEAVVFANIFHGTQVTFAFHQDATVEEGCTYTQGWWKNKKGSPISSQYDFDGGTNNGLTVLNTPPKGNPYYILAHQYIAATLNVQENGSSMDGDVLTAYNAATAYFLAASAGNPYAGGTYTKAEITALAGILDQYNQGILGPGHCDDDLVA